MRARLIVVPLVAVVAMLAWSLWEGRLPMTGRAVLSDLAVEPSEKAPRAGLVDPSPRPRLVEHSSARDLLSERVVDTEARLRPAALAGDSNASLQIYLKLTQCADPMAAGLSEQEVAVYGRAGVSMGALADVTAKLQLECEGAQDLISQRGRWLERAASGGLRDAQILFAADPDSILHRDVGGTNDPAVVADYARRSEQYMLDLADSGDVESMLSLSLMYGGSRFTPRDQVKSAAYRLAAEAIAPLEVAPKPLSFTMRELSSQDQARATSLAREIRLRCCDR